MCSRIRRKETGSKSRVERMGGICEVVQYDEVLEIIRNDIQMIADLLPEEKKEEINRYRETVFR